VCSKALSLAPEGVVKQPMEMEGRGATKQARGSSAGSSASSEVSGEPVLAGEDEEASVVAESPHPDDEGRPRKDKHKRAPRRHRRSRRGRRRRSDRTAMCTRVMRASSTAIW
jgi:hypothetical protein